MLSPLQVFENAEEYLEWYDKEHAPAANIAPNAPCVGLVLQKSHINTKVRAANMHVMCQHTRIIVLR